MARIVGYIATSLDGFIATPDENLDWLTQQPDLNLGGHDYRKFIETIRTVVMGRATYDWIARYPGEWEYAGKRVIVTGWAIASEGRKHRAGTALHDRNGELLAAATATWITLEQAAAG